MKGKDIIYTAEDYNQDELVPPKWLTQEYLEEFLRKHHNDDLIQIKNYHISPASKKGDHYASIMFRIEMEYKTKASNDAEISVILKTLPEEDCAKNEMFQKSSVFKTEISIYENIIPKFEAILKENGDDTKLGPKMLYSTVEPRKIIIFEDLAVKSFSSISMRSPTMEESKMSLAKLAKWHAISFKLHSDGDESISQYHDGVLNIPNVENMEIFNDGINQFIAMLKRDTELQKFVPKFENLREKNILKKCVAIHNLGRGYRENSPSEIFVLNHGDFHTKNVMFKFNNSGIATDVLLIDYQICIWGPAILDIFNFIFLMLDPKERLTKRNEYIYFYFTNFIDTLKLIKYNGPLPKLTNLYIDMMKYRYVEIYLLVSFLPYVYGITSKKLMNEIGSTNVFESPEAKTIFYRNPDYIDEVKILLPHYLHNGFLDVE